MDVREQIRSILGVDGAEASRLHAEHLNPAFVRALDSLGLNRHFVRGEGIALWDDAGRRYLDFLAGYGAVSVGHNHPVVRGGIEEVLASHAPHFLLIAPQPLAAEVVRRLCRVAPGGLDTGYLASSGSEAVEGALKLARLATRRPRFVSAEGSYHGTTFGALSVTGSRTHRAPFEPLLASTLVPWGDAAAIARELQRRDVAAVVLEPVQGEGGVRLPPPGYLAEVARMCKREGALFVVDEVMTGLGRCGSMFASLDERVEPDVVLLAKGLSGGLAPVSALLTRKALWARAYGAADTHDLHCSTFSGGPIACAAALATLHVLEEEGLTERAADVGAYLGERLRAVTRGHAFVKDVRGRGLLWGIEVGVPLVGVAAELLSQWIVVGLLERGVLTQVCSAAPHVVRAQPPLCATRADVDAFIAALEGTLAQHAKGTLQSLAGAAGRLLRNGLNAWTDARRANTRK